MGDELVTGNARDDEGVMLWAAGADDDGVSGAQAVERSDADFVEVGPNLAEEDFAFLELQFVRTEVGCRFPSVERERTTRDVFETDVWFWLVELSFRHVAAHVLRNVAELLYLPALGDVAKWRIDERDLFVAGKAKVDEPLAEKRAGHFFQNLDALLVVFDQVVVG